MGTLFSSLAIGMTGLRAAQIQLDTAGHNIANVNRAGYSRQRVDLATFSPNILPEGAVGRGVFVQNISRTREGFLDGVLRTEYGSLGFTEVQGQYYNLIEDALQEPGENGFGTRLDNFFDVLADFANNVESLPVREVLASEAQSLASGLNDLVSRFDQLRTNANEEVRNLVEEINGLGDRLVILNEQIRVAQGNGATANDLSDERDVVLDDLSKLINITTREIDNGEITVLIDGNVFIDSTGIRSLEAVREPALDPERNDLLEVRFADSGQPVSIRSGELFGALNTRDTIIPALDARIDELTASLIREINNIHAQGNGLNNLSGTLSTANEVNSPANPLIAAGLPFDVTAGSFDVVVYDANGVPTTTTINITGATTLNSLATALDAIPNFDATVVGNTLQFGTTAPFTFGFANDSTGALAALGANPFFTGTDARTIAFNPVLANDPSLITSGFSDDPLNTGDNTAALQMAALRTARVLDSGSSTLNDFYQSTIAAFGVESRSNEQQLSSQGLAVQDLERRRQEQSGVSLDEEVTNLLVFQRAYEASARVITIADRMLETLINVAQ
ncbi:MAG: hypothetical protein AMXMBFR84_25080 [Candidatus Hydrogenedentota bacterium]